MKDAGPDAELRLARKAHLQHANHGVRQGHAYSGRGFTGVDFAERFDGPITGAKQISSLAPATGGFAMHGGAAQNLNFRTMLGSSNCMSHHAPILRRNNRGPIRSIVSKQLQIDDNQATGNVA